jgi:ketosteroid isomerase-like protein
MQRIFEAFYKNKKYCLIMKNTFIKGTLLSCTLSFIFACNQKEESPTPVVDKEQIKKEIQAKEDEFAATYNAGELKDIGYYADDASSFYQNKAPLIGKPAIVDYLKSDLISNTDKISFKTNDVFVSNDGKQVVEIGYFKVVDSANNPINTGNYMSLFEKRDSTYKCIRDMSASDIPLK